MAEKILKYLIQKLPTKGIGIIYLWTAALAKRADMHPYEGALPKTMRINLSELNSLTSVRSSADPSTALPEEPAIGGPGAIVAVVDADAGEAGGVVVIDTDEKPLSLIPELGAEEKHAKLVKIMAAMDAGNDEHFDAAGMPRIDFLIMALDGADVSSAERDAAFAELGKSPVPAAEGTSVVAEQPLTPGQRIDKILSAMDELKTADFTDKHIPKVSALSKVCGFDVDGGERTTAFEAFMKANPGWQPSDFKEE